MPRAPSRVPGLDTLRAVAIVWVVHFHAMTMSLGSPGFAVTKFGWMGVDLFFVLSGLLIGTQWLESCKPGEPMPVAGFYQRRALRILPAYLLMVALYFAFPALWEFPFIQPAWQFLTFTENLFADFSHRLAFSHVWSLCVEEHFYLFLPPLAWLLLRRPSAARTALVFAGLLLFGIALRAYIWKTDLSKQGDDTLVIHFYERIYYPSWTRLDGLLVGVLLAVVKTQRPAWWAAGLRRANLALALGLGLLLACAFIFRDQLGGLAIITGFPLLAIAMGLIVFACSTEETWIGRLRIPGISMLAALAYSLYLSHKMVLRAVGNALGNHPVSRPLAYLAYALATLAAALALHYGLERPFLRLRERLRSRKRIAPSPIAP